MAKAKKPTSNAIVPAGKDYAGFLSGVSELLDASRHSAARAVNAVLTATYWEVGRRIVLFEQGGKARAAYGEALLQRLADDLGARHGRGFSERNLRQIRAFYLGWEIRQTPSAELVAQARLPQGNEKRQTPSAVSLGAAEQLDPAAITPAAFPLPWSH